ncbi:stearoyl-CoA desaturase (delta-9 desaturase) [Inhella inkyongensis]|uniref:Stearoyl-CoA desaturase (Delta-9 desaturase) n=1 Tax=Inhella inkyongensis TaxID=392593 RepID=A0A840SCC9_9BURK|nr:fatty acid desaturase [Inhella inkyongensis]MBB5206414.1 stearoyl-CoA desaturase (delta-9 desaturase) [Inhella inkyongensis]
MNAWTTAFDAFATWAGNGLSHASGWTMLLVLAVTTHLTILGVTLYLHRSQAHRALDLHPVVSHFFRFWLWLTTGMVTREWVAIHRKHHAKCETHDDPHSPQTRGLKTVLLAGSELYRAEAKNAETIAKYSLGTPTDWIERNLYIPHSALGVSLLLVIELALFGGWGAAIWATQMLWIPINAAGIINGIGHFWGYRNFEAPDASTNISPIGWIIGGEELHNNHHTFPTSAKFSVKRFEFDLGWGYIRVLQALGLAKPRKTPPRVVEGAVQPADRDTLEALIANRYEVMARFARETRAACRAELVRIKAEGAKHSARWQQFKLAKRWLPRDADRIPAQMGAELAAARQASPVLDQWVTMREELRQMWTRTNVSAEQLVKDLQAWCQRAEASGIAELSALSVRLRATRLPAMA